MKSCRATGLENWLSGSSWWSRKRKTKRKPAREWEIKFVLRKKGEKNEKGKMGVFAHCYGGTQEEAPGPQHVQEGLFSQTSSWWPSTPAQVYLVHDCGQVPGTQEALKKDVLTNGMYLWNLDCKALFRESFLYLSALTINARSENTITIFIVLEQLFPIFVTCTLYSNTFWGVSKRHF